MIKDKQYKLIQESLQAIEEICTGKKKSVNYMRYMGNPQIDASEANFPYKYDDLKQLVEAV